MRRGVVRPTRENFGKGEIEGVAASEAGNNGVCGATLIPLLALGVPGDVITAIVIGAFMVHGLQPGPMMFVANANIVYALFLGSDHQLGTAARSSVAWPSRLFRYIVDVPRSVLMPSVLILCVFGVYAVNNNVFDIIVMFGMGWLGYFMMRNNIPAAPFLIAFILGPLLEDNFRQAMLMSNGDPPTSCSAAGSRGSSGGDVDHHRRAYSHRSASARRGTGLKAASKD